MFSEDGDNEDLRNLRILPRRRRQHGLPKRWYPTTTLHSVRTQ